MLQLRGTGALVITAFLDFLTFALCAPYSETTDGTCFDSLLEMVANEGRVIFRLFQVCVCVRGTAQCSECPDSRLI